MTDDLLDSFLTQENQDAARTYKKEDEVLAPLAEELSLINDSSILDFTRSMLYQADSCFWTAAAGNVPDEYPPDTYEEGGLIVHTKRMVRLAAQMGIAQGLDDTEMDMVICASLIHGLTKVVEVEGTVVYDHFHAYTIDKMVAYRRAMDEQSGSEAHSTTIWLDDDILADILRMVRCQKGIWSPIPETIPSTTLEWIVHTADLLASNIHHMIDGHDIEEWRWIKEE